METVFSIVSDILDQYVVEQNDTTLDVNLVLPLSSFLTDFFTYFILLEIG